MFDGNMVFSKDTSRTEANYMQCTVKLLWDAEACVWVATSDDVPGLVLESGSFDAMIERLHYVIPELLELNCKNINQCNIKFIGERQDQVSVYG